MDTIWNDLRFALRLLKKNPGFTAVAVIALALGIGANTAIFSVVNEVLLRQLPYREPDRLVMIWERNRPRSRNMNSVSPANFLDWKDQSQTFEQMAGLFQQRFNLTGVDDPEELPAHVVTANFFPTLGVVAARGRTFTDQDAVPDSARVVILSHGLWQRRFGGVSDVVGKTVTLSGNPYTIIGVMSPDFQFFVKHSTFGGKPAEMWLPARFSPNARIRSGRFMAAIGRIKPDVTIDHAQAEMNAIGSRLEQQYPDFNTGWGINLVPLDRQLTGEIRPALLVLFGAVGFVLLIACANVANLLLARAAVREKEIAVRAALGASRRRIVAQLLTESVLLAGIGGALGLLLARWGIDLLLALAPEGLLRIKSVSTDFRVLGFACGAALLTGLIFGIVPALVASRPQLHDALKEGGRGASTGIAGTRLRGAFVMAEVALALVLLIGAGLLIRSFLRLQAVDPGFNTQKLLTVRVLLPGSKYGEDHQVIGFFRQLLQRIEALPGVRSASANSFPPFVGLGSTTGFLVEGRPAPRAGQVPVTDVRVVDPKYFSTMGIPLKEGRTFNDREATEASHVVIINETLARQYFQGENPIGRRITIDMKDENVPSEIIGVVGDVMHDGLGAPVGAMSYWPHPELVYSFMTLLVRTQSDPLQLAGAIQREVKALDKDQPIADVRTMDQLLANSMASARFLTLLLSIFAVVAMVLSTVGIYGVMSYSVAQRSREIGIRVALGAQSIDVVRLVVGQGLLLATGGVAIGLLAAFVLTRLMSGVLSNLLYAVEATDALTFGGISVLLTAVALLACYVPARRAAKVDPLIALRYE